MPEQNTRFIVQGIKALAKSFELMVRKKLAATKTVEDVAKDLKRQGEEIEREVSKIKRAWKSRPR